VWDLKEQGYEDEPVTLYDHEDEIVSADLRPSDSMLATMDIQGTVLIRCVKRDSDIDSVLYTITSLPKDVDDVAKVIFNRERPEDEGELLVLVNDQILLLDLNGRQLDSITTPKNCSVLELENYPVMDADFIYRVLCMENRKFVL